MNHSTRALVGAVLAGGQGRRLGDRRGKAMAELAGRPLVAYPVAALSEVCERVAVVCKADTRLPELPGVERWDEPAEPRHPLTGIVHALESAAEAALVCASDMPLVGAPACRRLLEAAAASGGAAAVIATADGVLQPLLGVYRPSALERLHEAPPGSRLRDVVAALDPITVALPSAALLNVNTAEDLLSAERALARQRRSST